MAGNHLVGDFVNFAQRVLGGFNVKTFGQHPAGGKVFGGGNGIAGDERSACGQAQQQAALAGGIAGQREQVYAGGELVGGDLHAFEQSHLALQRYVVL